MDELIRVATAGLALYIVAAVVVFALALAIFVHAWRSIRRTEAEFDDDPWRGIR